jgi:hypothetical protein
LHIPEYYKWLCFDDTPNPKAKRGFGVSASISYWVSFTRCDCGFGLWVSFKRCACVGFCGWGHCAVGWEKCGLRCVVGGYRFILLLYWIWVKSSRNSRTALQKWLHKFRTFIQSFSFAYSFPFLRPIK